MTVNYKLPVIPSRGWVVLPVFPTSYTYMPSKLYPTLMKQEGELLTWRSNPGSAGYEASTKLTTDYHFLCKIQQERHSIIWHDSDSTHLRDECIEEWSSTYHLVLHIDKCLHLMNDGLKLQLGQTECFLHPLGLGPAVEAIATMDVQILKEQKTGWLKSKTEWNSDMQFLIVVDEDSNCFLYL